MPSVEERRSTGMIHPITGSRHWPRRSTHWSRTHRTGCVHASHRPWAAHGSHTGRGWTAGTGAWSTHRRPNASHVRWMAAHRAGPTHGPGHNARHDWTWVTDETWVSTGTAAVGSRTELRAARKTGVTLGRVWSPRSARPYTSRAGIGRTERWRGS